MNDFNLNSLPLFLAAGLIVLFVLAQSVFFLIKAWKRAGELGIQRQTLRRVVSASAVFTIAPAVAIILGVITLSKFLGLPLPWLRLSVLGALTYELPAATAAADALNIPSGEAVANAVSYSTIAWVMTLGIMSGLLIITFFSKNIHRGLDKLSKRDKKWNEIFLAALFMGMISAFLGYIFSDIRSGLVGWIPVFVMLVSALIMAFLGILVKSFKVKWLEDYALPISMLGAMAASIPLTRFLA